MKRARTGLIFGAASYAIAWASGASSLWSTLAGLVGAAIAVALT